ncbi:hypothetical protein [Streptomyces misionensis]|uniref:hypothetical protein n=1 Tax=Streptomyces misionensis TaxID=67331 RepID=UPI00164420CC|nr:hypothetical protein [Streptomyces misionensis]
MVGSASDVPEALEHVKGNLRTTTKATADGSFRYSFAGTSTTPAVASAADHVDVR